MSEVEQLCNRVAIIRSGRIVFDVRGVVTDPDARGLTVDSNQRRDGENGGDACGRLNAEGFVFATLIDRPFVAPTMATLWYLGILPGPLALLFGIEDSVSWLWTLLTWRAEHRQ